jgi:diacylglycerol O-acyltransferase / wax synthase
MSSRTTTRTGDGHTPSHMRDSDAFSWYMERDPLLRSTVVVVALLDRPPRWSTLVEKVERASHRIPLLRTRVEQPPFRLATPRWVPVADVDLSWHLRRVSLPSPGGWPALLDLARRAAVTAFDPARPMWEMTLVEGMPDGRAALVQKFHHALTDGVGGVQLAMELFDLERSPAPDTRPIPSEDHQQLSGLRLTLDDLAFDASRLLGLARAVPRAGVRAAATVARSPVGAATGAVRVVRSVARTVAPFSTTMSPVMRERRLARSFDVLEVPLDDLHRAAHAAGGHLNDAFLGGITGGLRRYHERHGSAVDRLRVTLPISLRGPADAPGGNHLTLVRFAVPAGTADPVQRMREIGAEVARWREEPSLELTQAIAATLNLLPPAVVGGMLKHVDFLASNVPGFPVPVYLAGARVEGYYPFGPTIGSSVNVTLLSYVDTCCIGVSCDAAAVPDPHVLAECLQEGFGEVLALAGEHAPVRLPARTPTTSPT